MVMENREFGSIVGNASAPYLNSLIARYRLATAYTAVAHPSEPNYLALFSGSTQGVTDDGVYDLVASNLADQLEAHARSWRVFAQNVPAGCYTGGSASGGADGPGTYARKHEPAISFSDIATSAARCGHITDFSTFDPSAADFELIVPNLCNDMHDCPVSSGDAFLRSFVPQITENPAFADSVLFITWDEGSTDIGGGGRVATLVVSPRLSRVPPRRSPIPTSRCCGRSRMPGTWAASDTPVPPTTSASSSDPEKGTSRPATRCRDRAYGALPMARVEP